MAKNKDTKLVAIQELEPIDDHFNVEKNESMVGAINSILSNVQILINYLEWTTNLGILCQTIWVL